MLPILERNLIPDAVIRFGIQREIEMEIQKINKLPLEERAKKTQEFVEQLKSMPIAVEQKKANDQHYEVCIILLY
jgi:proteasome assembly chaperone (PAC2) family protein